MKHAEVTWAAFQYVILSSLHIVPTSSLHGKSVVCLPRRETTRKVHRGELSRFEGAAQDNIESCKWRVGWVVEECECECECG